MLFSFLLLSPQAHGQLLKRIKQEVKNRAGNRAVSEAGNATDKALDKAKDEATGAAKKKGDTEAASPAETAETVPPQTKSKSVKAD